jgi:hypothetical protein
MSVLPLALALAAPPSAAAQPLRQLAAPPVIEEPHNGTTVQAVHLAGSTDPGTAVVVTEDGNVLDAVTPDASNHWELTRHPQPDGQHTYSAHAVDSTGAQVSAETTPPITVTVDTTGPAAPAIDTPAEGDTVAAIQLAGTADVQSVVVITEGGEERGRATAPAGGHWQIDVTGLTDGTHTFVAHAEDAFGNASPQTAPRTVVLDTDAPSAPVVTGEPNALSYSTDDPGARFECSLDAGPPGACATDYSTLPPGSHTLTVLAVDRVGNRSPKTEHAFTIAAVVAPTPEPTATPSAVFSPPLVPRFHASVVVRRFGGTVRVHRAGRSAYSVLKAAQALPLGSSVDAKHGAVVLQSVPRPGAATQRTTLEGGIFRVTQPGGVTVLTLTESLAPCGRKGRHSRRLAGNGSGAFRTRGAYSSSSGGQRWVVQDTCAGTLTRVIQGVVSVRDQVRRRTVLVRAGKRYLARPRP